MPPKKITDPASLALRKEKRKEYMRNYKKQKYKEDKNLRDYTKEYYYKKKYNMSMENVKALKHALPMVDDLKKLMKEISTLNDPDEKLRNLLINEFIEYFTAPELESLPSS